MNRKFHKLIEIACALKPAKQTHESYFHVAFILNKKAIVSIGWNDTNKSHPATKKYPYHQLSKIHAEMSAILKMKGKDCSHLTLVVIRLNAKNELKNSKPCKGCQAMITENNFSKVWYSNDNGEFESLFN
jgi:deoxycytidylate deaminase